MLTPEQTRLTLAQTHSKSDKILELLILFFNKGKRGAKSQRAYLKPSGQHSRRLNHHRGREKKRIKCNWLMLTLEQIRLTLAQTHS